MKRELNLKDAIFIYGISLVGMLIFSVVSAMVPEGNLQIYLSYLFPQIAYIVATVVYVKARKVAFFGNEIFSYRVNPLGILLTLPILVGVFCQDLIIAQAFSWLVELTGVTPSIIMPTMNNAKEIIIAIILLCVLPAIGEEMLYRGVFLHSMKRYGATFAVVVSGIIFALTHFNVAQIVHQCILGMILSYVTLVSGRLIYAMVIHFVNNLVAIILPIVIPSYNNLATLNTTSVLIMLAMMVAGIIILYPSLFGFAKIAGRREFSRRECNFFTLFSKNARALWYNNMNECEEELALPAKVALKQPIFIGFMVFLVVMSVASFALEMMVI